MSASSAQPDRGLRSADQDLGSYPGDDPIRVLFCCDPGYHQHLAVALASLVANNRANRLDLHLIASRRDPVSEARLRASIPPHPHVALRIHDFSWDGRGRWHTSFHITREAYMRLFAPEVLAAQVDRILYLDCDLVVLGDLAPLWATDISRHAAAAVPDPFGASRRAELGMAEGSAYVNSGVLLLNLARWRADGLSQQVMAYVEREGGRLLFHDQDALNAVLGASIRRLGYRWNVQARMLRLRRSAKAPDGEAMREAARAPAIVHYTSARKPWLFVMATPGARLYRRYLGMTAWRGAAPLGRKLSATPEFLVNHLMYALGVDTTWDRLLRATRPGRALGRLLGWLGMRPAEDASQLK